MKTLNLALALFALCVLASCGGGSKPASGPKKTEKSDAPSEAKTVEPAKTAEPAKSAEKTEEAKTVTETKTAAPTTPAPVKVDPPKVAADDKPVWGKASEAEGDPIGGKTIGYYVNDLAEKDKTKLLDAIEYCRMAGPKAARGIPMLEKLSKNADKEIADAATEALKEVKR